MDFFFLGGKKVFSTNNSKIPPPKKQTPMPLRHVGLISFFLRAGWVKFWGDFSNERDDFRNAESEEKSRSRLTTITTNKRQTTKSPRDFEDSWVL